MSWFKNLSFSLKALIVWAICLWLGRYLGFLTSDSHELVYTATFWGFAILNYLEGES